MSNKLGQLSFDYIFSMDGEKFRRLVKFKAVEIDQYQYRFQVDSRRLPRGVNELSMCTDEVMMSLGLSIGKTVVYHLEPGTGLWFLVDRESGLRNIPKYVDYMDAYNTMGPKDSPLTIPIGLGAGRAPIKLHLDRDTTAHFLVAGTTGGGKTVALHTIICSFLRQHPEDIQLILVDLKQIEFQVYEGLPHLHRPIVTQTHEVLPLVEWLWNETDRRLRLIRKAGNVNNLRKLNASRGKKIPYLVCVFDELANYMLDPTVPKSDKGEVESYMARIASIGRAAGVHVILATQRPNERVLTPLITANFPGRIATACASNFDSIVIIGNGDACFKEHVPSGRAILSYGRHRLQFQVAFLKDCQRDQIISDVKMGKFGQFRMTHDVTVNELAEFALENFEGAFRQDSLYYQFKDRGVTRDNIRAFVDRYSQESFTIASDRYHLEIPTERFKPVRVVKDEVESEDEAEDKVEVEDKVEEECYGE
jgi:DNA segregation ATPase FtsK/SpoIIIE-like protein